MGVVPQYPPDITVAGTEQRIRAAAPVVGNGQWREMADLVNWLTGRGAQLVAGNPMMVSGFEFAGLSTSDIEAGSVRDHIAYVWPRSQFTSRVWLVSMICGEGTSSGEFRTNSDDVLGTWSITATGIETKTRGTFRVVEPWSPSTGLINLRISSNASSDSGVFILGWCCFEMPVVSNAGIPNEQTLNSGAPIYEEDSNQESLDMVAMTADSLDTHARRCSLFSWYSNDELTITATTFTGTANIFRVPPHVVPRMVNSSDTTRAVDWVAYARGAGGAGEIRVTWGSGHVTTVTIASSVSYLAVTGQSAVETEDPTRWDIDGGIRGGSRDYATIEVRCTTATSVRIKGFWMGEST